MTIDAPGTGVLWADIIVSFIAFGIALVALPTVLQMFWGRPVLELEFSRAVEDRTRALVVFVKNPPVKSRLLKGLRVRRDTIQSLTASFRVSESGSRKVIAPILHALFYTDEELNPIARQRISLPPTYTVGTSFSVAVWKDDEEGTVLVPDRLRQPLRLNPGLYHVQVIMLVDGQQKRYERRFLVGERADDLVWVSPP